MAFGGLKGTLKGNGNSVGTSNALTGSVAVAVGDLVVVVFGQQTNLTASGASSSLVTSYSAQNAGTDAGVATGRCFYGVVTSAGTLTQVDVAASSSTNDWCGVGAVIEGPFISAPIDGNPANITSDTTSPFTCPLSGTLAQAHEAVIGWGAANGSTTWAATSPNLLADNANNSTNIKVAVGYQKVIVTTSIAPEFTAAANPSVAVLGTVSFKGSLSADFSTTLASLTSSANASVDNGVTLSKTLGTLTASSQASVADDATLSKTFGAATVSAVSSVEVGATLSKTLGTLTASSSATVQDAPLEATVSQALAALTASASATVDIGITSANTLAALASSADASVDLSATLSKTLGTATASASATIDEAATASKTLETVTFSCAASVDDSATASNALGSLTSSAISTADVVAAFAKTLADATLSATATGEVAGDATLSQTLAALSSSAEAAVDVEALVARALEDLTRTTERTDLAGLIELGAMVSSAYATVRRFGDTSTRASNMGGGGISRPSAAGSAFPRSSRQTSAPRRNRPTGLDRP